MRDGAKMRQNASSQARWPVTAAIFVSATAQVSKWLWKKATSMTVGVHYRQQLHAEEAHGEGQEEEEADARELATLLSDNEEDECGGTVSGLDSKGALFTESVMAILSKMTPACGDEYVLLAVSWCFCLLSAHTDNLLLLL